MEKLMRMKCCFYAIVRTLAVCLIPSGVGLSQGTVNNTYTFTAIDYPGAVHTQPNGINSGNVISGSWNDGSFWHGFFLSGAIFTSIHVPGQEHTGLRKINSSNVAVGGYGTGLVATGLKYSANTFESIMFPGAFGTGAEGINASGVIVGTYWPPNYQPRAFILNNGIYSDLDFPGWPTADALAINDAGSIVGWVQNATGQHSFLFQGGILTVFDFPGSSRSFAHGINNSGEIVGSYWDQSGFLRGYVRTANGFQSIVFPGTTSTQHTQVASNNDNGTIVGTYSDGTRTRGFIANRQAPAPAYRVCLLYDPTKAVKSGATIPIKIQLCDSNSNNLSSATITLHATSLTRISTNTSAEIYDAGNANADNDFRYDATLGGTGGYIFNLKTSGLLSGTYQLTFTAGTSTTTYSVQFQVK